MAKKIRLEDLGTVLIEEIKEESALEYKATAFEMFGQVIEKTPVDTGRARGNWNITTDAPDHNTTESTQVQQPNIDVGTDFPTIYIANGLDYVEGLEEGKSRKAPNGIINPALAAARANRRR